jgi:hypothetical protein
MMRLVALATLGSAERALQIWTRADQTRRGSATTFRAELIAAVEWKVEGPEFGR